jgi:hypothetical protein
VVTDYATIDEEALHISGSRSVHIKLVGIRIILWDIMRLRSEQNVSAIVSNVKREDPVGAYQPPASQWCPVQIYAAMDTPSARPVVVQHPNVEHALVTIGIVEEA